MRLTLYKMFALVLLAIISGLSIARAEAPKVKATTSLADKMGDFRALGPASVPAEGPRDEERISYAVRRYKAPSGKTYLVNISQTRTNGAAYSLLTATLGFHDQVRLGVAGAAAYVGLHRVLFCKGNNIVEVESTDRNASSQEEMVALAEEFANGLDGENELPVLVKHLPQWEKVGLGASYAVTINRLKLLLPNQPVLDALSLEGGAEAVVAHYDTGILAIVEFNTPQTATSNDHSIAAKINELRSAIPPSGTSLPTAYRRVGNYAVFVFEAPTPEAANQLIDQVKYQQVVQWLGENPFSYEKATREFTETTLGVFVSVVQASGLALVTCLAIGGLFGTVLFRFRRSQQRAREAYADSDAMLRLNLDELTPESDPSRLLGRGN